MYEAVNILREYKNPKKRRAIILHWIEHDLLACSERTILRRLKDEEEDNVMPKRNDLGNVRGRNPLNDIENISLLNHLSPTKRPNVKGVGQIKAAIKAQQTIEFEERGLSTHTVRSPSKTSLRNYHTLAATEPGVSLTKITIHNAENDLQSRRHYDQQLPILQL